jgi:hypothetical protein
MQQTLPVAWADHVHQLLSCMSTLGQGSCGNTVTMSPVSWTNRIERERTHSLIYSLVCGNERNVQRRKRKALSLSTAWNGFLCYQYMVISKKNRKLSIHYSASSECFHYTLEASPLYSLSNHPSSSTHSYNSKSHAKYGEETFQSKQAHRIVHWHFLPTNGVPIFYSFELSLYSLCAKCWPLELKSSSYFALRSIRAELNYVRFDGRCKIDIETHWVYNPSPDILCGLEMQCNFVIWYL